MRYKTNNKVSRYGDIAETSVQLYFMEKGYEVFRNVSCIGPIDMIIVDTDTGHTRYIDVKSSKTFGINNSGIKVPNVPTMTELQQKLKVELVFVERSTNTVVECKQTYIDQQMADIIKRLP